jgi:hypothetical protein
MANGNAYKIRNGLSWAEWIDILIKCWQTLTLRK